MALRVLFLLLLAMDSLCSSELLKLDVQETAWRFKTANHIKVLSSLLPKNRMSVDLPVEVNPVTNAAGDCSWDTSTAQCDVSLSATAELFRQSDSEYAQFISQFAECEALSSVESCKATENCLWDSENLRCGFAQIDLGHEDSPCVTGAPAMINVYIYSQVCTTLKDNSSCLANPNCAWDDEDEVCDSDDWLFLYGFTHQDFNQVIDDKAPQYIQQFTETIDPETATFADILDWDPEPTECPESASSTVCDLADAIYQMQLPTVLYCNLKYGQIYSFPACLRDPLCEFDYDTLACSAATDVVVEAVIYGLQSISSSIEADADREVMQTVLDCSKYTDSSSCTGSCIWFESEGGSCGVGDELWMRKAAELGEGTDDPVCTYLSTLADSGCLDIQKPEECLAKTDCIVQIYGECSPSTEYLVSDTLLKDESVQASYSELQEECTAYTTIYACENDSDAPEADLKVLSSSTA